MTTLRLGGKIWHWPQNERTIWILRSSCPILGIVVSWWPGIRLQKAVHRLNTINSSFHNKSLHNWAFRGWMVNAHDYYFLHDLSNTHNPQVIWTFTYECCTKKWFCHQERLTTLWCFNRIMRIHFRQFFNEKLLPRKMFFYLSLPSRWDWRSQLTGGART